MEPHEHSFHWFISAVAILLAAGAFVMAHHARNDANRVQKSMCAWIIYEDGSASVRTDDASRFKCREDADK